MTATTTTRACPVPTKRGTACPHDATRDGLCPLHHPEATFAQQHPGYRLKLLRRPEVLAALAHATAPPPAPPAPLPPPVPAPARSQAPRGGGARAGGYLTELEFAAGRLAKVVAALPDPADRLAVAQWRIAAQRALEAHEGAKAMRRPS